MHILMLSWEFPPHHRSYLGRVCKGFAQGLAKIDHQVTVVLPRVYGEEDPGDVQIVSLEAGRNLTQQLKKNQSLPPERQLRHPLAKPAFAIKEANAAGLLQPGFQRNHHYFGRQNSYGSEVLEQVMRFGEKAYLLANLPFDFIHCHDWLTLPAGFQLKAKTGKPLVYHIHSLEGERAGDFSSNLVEEIERKGLTQADLLVTISHRAKHHIVEAFGIDPNKITVIHNGVSAHEYGAEKAKNPQSKPVKKVLFTGPFIFKKGPEYFVDAAAKVLEHYKDVQFIMAGSGEKLDAMLRKVNEWRLGDYFHFTGFLEGAALETVFSQADLYVMPSVDDPFGFQPLEAIVCDTPVIISKQSGVAEIIRHALAVDFWDVHRLAEYMLAILNYPALGKDLVSMARQELQQIHWRASAEAYSGLISQFPRD